MMRILGLVLVLLVLLCGCMQNEPITTAPSDEPTLPSTEPTQEQISGSYIPESKLEKATSGAVQCFTTGEGAYGSFPVRSSATAVLRKTEGKCILELFSGNSLIPEKVVSLGEGVFPAVEHFSVSQQGIAYYDSVDAAMVFLNHELREVGRMQMPQDAQGIAWLSPDWKTVYYCTIEGFYTLDLQSGISRLLKEQRSANQRITGLFAGGTVLRCTKRMPGAEAKTILVDTSTGEMIAEGTHFDSLQIWSNRYFFSCYEHTFLRYHFGIGKEPYELIWPKEEGDAYPLLSDDALAMATPGEKGVTLTYYRLNAGTRVAETLLPEVTNVFGLRADGQGGVWFFAENRDGAVTFCRWNPQKSTVEETDSYKEPCYTAENPDQDGLAALAEEAKALGDRYGVEILLWKDAAQLAPSDHIFEPEFLTQAYATFLPELEKVLASLPKEFYEKTVWEGKLRIAIVRSMTGDTQQGSLEKSTNLQYWLGQEPVIALAVDGDAERNFRHAMAHLIDTQVLSKSSAFYEWNTLNPEGFAYDNNYIANAERTDTTYIEGENRYFIDLFSMSYAKEDRARIFEYACMPGNEELFKAPVLQEKLRRICKGIRDVFHLGQAEVELPWEQYLTK